MCTTCGCGAGETRLEGTPVAPGDQPGAHDPHWHVHADGTAHSHAPQSGGGQQHHHHHHGHGHAYRQPQAHAETGHVHETPGAVDYGRGAAGAHAPGMTQSRMVQIERDILSKNDAYAERNRARFDEQGIFALNLVSSPGSGKTTLLCRTIAALKERHSINVVEGDQQTSHDAERIRATGVPALQINTGKGCHLDAHMVGHAVARLAPADGSLLLIENVGNLVCPAAFDLGEAHKVAILSVTEGEDKPLKYPDMFRAASLMLVNKVDLLPHLQFDVEQAIAYARRVNPQLEVLRVSATSGEGFDAWLAWIEAGLARQAKKRQETVASLRRRIAELEAQLAQR